MYRSVYYFQLCGETLTWDLNIGRRQLLKLDKQINGAIYWMILVGGDASYFFSQMPRSQPDFNVEKVAVQLFVLL